MTESPDFLTIEDVELLHDAQLRMFGGLEGVRDRGLARRMLERQPQLNP